METDNGHTHRCKHAPVMVGTIVVSDEIDTSESTNSKMVIVVVRQIEKN